ncbi:hypothetical protein BLOT_014705 [Blomia tropicalis]|nr:hypothetical protein BLOT_014705 [Blomia tropicalis]
MIQQSNAFGESLRGMKKEKENSILHILLLNQKRMLPSRLITSNNQKNKSTFAYYIDCTIMAIIIDHLDCLKKVQ